MVSPKNAMFMFTTIAPSAICFGAVYRVGDASGFEFNAIFHNVKEVTETNYQACNGTKAIATHFSGNDSFTLDQPGHRYFLCGFPNHCRYRKKVDIYVVSAPANSQPLSPPSPAAHQNPTNSASLSHHIFGVLFATKYLAMVVVLLYFV